MGKEQNKETLNRLDRILNNADVARPPDQILVAVKNISYPQASYKNTAILDIIGGNLSDALKVEALKLLVVKLLKEQVTQTVDPQHDEPRNPSGSPISRFHIPLEGGWKEHTYYVVDIGITPGNVVHRAILFVGFINNKADAPLSGGYTCVMNATYDGNHRPDLAHYIKAICEIPEMHRRDFLGRDESGKPCTS